MLTRDSKFLVSGSSDCSLKLFNFKERKLVHTFNNTHKGDIAESEIFAY